MYTHTLHPHKGFSLARCPMNSTVWTDSLCQISSMCHCMQLHGACMAESSGYPGSMLHVCIAAFRVVALIARLHADASTCAQHVPTATFLLTLVGATRVGATRNPLLSDHSSTHPVCISTLLHLALALGTTATQSPTQGSKHPPALHRQDAPRRC